MVNDELKELLNDSYQSSKAVLALTAKIVNKYSSDLDEIINDISEIMKNGIDNAPTTKLESHCVSIPAHLYYLSTGLEEIGIKLDTLEQDRKEKYNKVFLEADGSVQAKKAAAEIETSTYVMGSIVYKRAYTCLKEKMDTSIKLYEAIKKVLTKRISENDLSRQSKDV